ncbi:MAG: aspartate-semialdehyde dehydrogenase [Actinobacteria bacterium]|nr:MAG: aspartate-semialdehyde dehydrogenase [Actinomycetota bacterium]
MRNRPNVAVVGATGAVGEEMLNVLEQRSFPCGSVRALASERSAGMKVPFAGAQLVVEELTRHSFGGIDIALFSAGGSVSKEFAPAAVEAGAVVIDNSSAFRQEPGVPLVVPEVNPEQVRAHRGIIANPNCSTIQMVVVLKPLHDAARIRRIVVSTYQAVSGTGKKAVEELLRQSEDILTGEPTTSECYPHQIAFNVLPHIDVFFEDGYTKEEKKMEMETKKIMGDPSIAVTATCARVPVFVGHSEAVNVETEQELGVDRARELLQDAPGVELLDDPASNLYPLAVDAAGKDPCYVGRLREDLTVPNGLNMWIVSDNVRKGAALNAVQIAELLLH